MMSLQSANKVVRLQDCPRVAEFRQVRTAAQMETHEHVTGILLAQETPRWEGRRGEGSAAADSEKFREAC